MAPADSPFQTFDELLRAWRADPAAMPIGGGSAGGIDHMIATLLAREAGIDPAEIRYAAYAGGGELTINLLSTAPGTPDVGISGYNDFRDMITEGRLRALMVVAPERLEVSTPRRPRRSASRRWKESFLGSGGERTWSNR